MTMTSSSNFEIVRTLGVGGMATVFLARQSEGGVVREVAVKKLHSFLAADPMSVSVLEDEAQLGACIRHPNVVRVLDFIPAASEQDAPALVMEHVAGVDLSKLLRAATQIGRRLPLDVVAAIARDVLSGLHAAHECRRDDGLALEIVHRDVSPQNVLVGFDGVVRVTDFGVAKAAWRQQYTEQGAIKGKLGYLAPEQLNGDCDRRSDIFSFGVVLWELLTGHRMRSADGVEVLVEILYPRTEMPSMRSSEAACLDAIVMRALERNADDRFATAADMLDAMLALVAPASAERVAQVAREILDLADAPASSSAVTMKNAVTDIAMPELTEMPVSSTAPTRRRPSKCRARRRSPSVRDALVACAMLDWRTGMFVRRPVRVPTAPPSSHHANAYLDPLFHRDKRPHHRRF